MTDDFAYWMRVLLRRNSVTPSIRRLWVLVGDRALRREGFASAGLDKDWSPLSIAGRVWLLLGLYGFCYCSPDYASCSLMDFAASTSDDSSKTAT